MRIRKDKGIKIPGNGQRVILSGDIKYVDVFTVVYKNNNEKSFPTRIQALRYIYTIKAQALRNIIEKNQEYSYTQHNDMTILFKDLEKTAKSIQQELKKSIDNVVKS